MNICERISYIKDEIEDKWTWYRLGWWMLDPCKNVSLNYINKAGEKENKVLRARGLKYGLDVDEIKAVVNEKSMGGRVNIMVIEGGQICGDVSIRKR